MLNSPSINLVVSPAVWASGVLEHRRGYKGMPGHKNVSSVDTRSRSKDKHSAENFAPRAQ